MHISEQELANSVDSAWRTHGITETLSALGFVESGLNIYILGLSDSGKSYLAKAISIAACNSYKVEYHHYESLQEALVAISKAQDYTKPKALKECLRNRPAYLGQFPVEYYYRRV